MLFWFILGFVIMLPVAFAFRLILHAVLWLVGFVWGLLTPRR